MIEIRPGRGGWRPGAGRKATCNCGLCAKCRHRERTRKKRWQERFGRKEKQQ